MTKEMFEEITSWQKKVFTSANALSAVHHLSEEVTELELDLSSHANNDKTVSEYADCFLLLFGSACLYGLSYDDICNAINAKMEINRKRKWGSVNEQGYVKHINFNKGESVCLIEDDKMEEFFCSKIYG